MKAICALMIVLFLAGCQSSTSYHAPRKQVPFFHSFEEIPEPYAVIGTVKATNPYIESTTVTRSDLQRIAAEENADAIAIIELDAQLQQDVFYTGNPQRTDHRYASAFRLTRVPDPSGGTRTVTTTANGGETPLVAVFLRYLY